MQLRPYQTDAVRAVIQHFRHHRTPALLVLPTGAGKSVIIAELARLARGRVLVLTHVQELVEQNHAKLLAMGQAADIYSAGLGRKQAGGKVVFASIQSLAASEEAMSQPFSMVIIDECHRVNLQGDSQYNRVIQALERTNPRMRLLGLTATPYRLDQGWVYRKHINGTLRSPEPKPFETCIFELPIGQLIKQGYLTPARIIDGAIASLLLPVNDGDADTMLISQGRATTLICDHLTSLGASHQGVLVFAATVRHGQEVVSKLPPGETALITGDTPAADREGIIRDFKARRLKFLVNVSVLTTGFDAPHIDLIAILRRTDSVALFQQMVGRGLRLSEGKKECLVLDFAGNGYSLFSPEVGEPKPKSDSQVVTVSCPKCGHANHFWGKCDDNGLLLEHFGRRCQGLDPQQQQCDFRFRFKECPDCLAENDIAARHCHACDKALVDPDTRLKEVLKLKDYLVLRCAGLSLTRHSLKSGQPGVKVTWHDEDGAELSQIFGFATPGQRGAFYHHFARMHLRSPGIPLRLADADAVVDAARLFRHPDFVIARREKYGWKVIETLFDYRGRYRKADSAD
ncbi:DEAD/DEAH box helicase [Ferrimonas sediminicola]|uniref:DEAD/DEAH box helicase n=1 Tax=Ferrimonas sediminicola TaxID=2569538 RepID=A0A4U1BD54_9GAMM|nr:DEAD/DEAH box helicase [Ferrimonas sediminicola]TKB48942.1 DEAD/DEAH box helicase [Ferrimonas sediminicola]